jgi:hypothetical protein
VPGLQRKLCSPGLWRFPPPAKQPLSNTGKTEVGMGNPNSPQFQPPGLTLHSPATQQGMGGVSPHPSFCHNPLSPSLSPRVSDSAASPSSPLSPWRLLGGTRRGTPQPCACCHPQFFPGVHSCALQNLGFKHPECQPLAPSTGLRPAL